MTFEDLAQPSFELQAEAPCFLLTRFWTRFLNRKVRGWIAGIRIRSHGVISFVARRVSWLPSIRRIVVFIAASSPNMQELRGNVPCLGFAATLR